MFNSIAKWKIWAVIAGIGLIMFQRIKYLKAKNERLEHNEEVREKIEEIHAVQVIDEKEALEDEPEKIKQRVKQVIGTSRRDRFSRL